MGVDRECHNLNAMSNTSALLDWWKKPRSQVHTHQTLNSSSGGSSREKTALPKPIKNFWWMWNFPGNVFDFVSLFFLLYYRKSVIRLYCLSMTCQFRNVNAMPWLTRFRIVQNREAMPIEIADGIHFTHSIALRLRKTTCVYDWNLITTKKLSVVECWLLLLRNTQKWLSFLRFNSNCNDGKAS